MAHFLQCHSGSKLNSLDGISGLKLSGEIGAISKTALILGIPIILVLYIIPLLFPNY
jgi:hypothetical protein